jgi:putative heme-binding domain-containing protein
MVPFRPKRSLIMNPDEGVRARARKLLTPPEQDREQAWRPYREALAAGGNAPMGRGVFNRVCKECHMLNGDGADVGPDLATLATRPAAAILNDILAPNDSIAQTYESYLVTTTDGRTLEGVMGPESASSISLRRKGGEQDIVPRSEIREIRASQLSAMPDDLAGQISPREIADLIWFIKSAR